MTREQAQAYMRRLSKEERKLLEELMAALSPKGEIKATPADHGKKQRKEK
ncbi:MAG: hypothetical protein II351_02425 [Clostridia bacterium]|nr:hypothetical protein [Clostridia bacterium]